MATTGAIARDGGLAKAGTADPYDQDDRERNERRR